MSFYPNAITLPGWIAGKCVCVCVGGGGGTLAGWRTGFRVQGYFIDNASVLCHSRESASRKQDCKSLEEQSKCLFHLKWGIFLCYTHGLRRDHISSFFLSACWINYVRINCFYRDSHYLEALRFFLCNTPGCGQVTQLHHSSSSFYNFTLLQCQNTI